MKSIIVAGAPRAGKTTLARRICAETGRSHLPADALVSSFARLYPELGIRHDEEAHDRVCGVFQEFLRELLAHYRYEDVPVVLDVFHVTPAWLLSMKEHCDVIVLGYPGTEVVEKRRSIRASERAGEWTANLTDGEMDELVTAFVTRSRDLESACETLGLPFVDVGDDVPAALARAMDLVSSTRGDEE